MRWRASVVRLPVRLSRRLVRLFLKLFRPPPSDRPGGDVHIISYPKAGRTWLRVLIGKALCLTYHLPDELILRIEELTRRAGVTRVRFRHKDAVQKLRIPYDRLSTDRQVYARDKVVLVVRDVKDILVSAYFEATKRERLFRGSLADFVRSPEFGVRKVATFYDIWYQNRTVPRALLVVHYEELHENPARVLAEILCFMGLESVDDTVLQDAVAFASFQNMRRLEAADYFEQRRLRPGDPNDDESYKVRRGVAGGYRDYLSQSDIDYIDRVVAEVGCPWLQPRAAPAPSPASATVPRDGTEPSVLR